ncbi:hypothetical protein BCL50_2337 [Mycolicibacterium litorale]|nr:hypothetical protein BCL50_2337 [Mycolicibacterium litorale]
MAHPIQGDEEDTAAGATSAQNNAIAPRPPRRHRAARQGHSCLPQAFCPPRRSVLQACALEQHAARRSQRPRHGETIGRHRICRARTARVSALLVLFDANTVRRRATRYSCSAAKRPRATPPPHTLPARHCDTARQTIQLAAPAPTRTGSRGALTYVTTAWPDHRAAPRPHHGAPPPAASPTVPVEYRDRRGVATHIGRRRDASAPSAQCCHPAGRTDVLMGFCCRRDLDAHGCRIREARAPQRPLHRTRSPTRSGAGERTILNARGSGRADRSHRRRSRRSRCCNPKPLGRRRHGCESA